MRGGGAELLDVATYHWCTEPATSNDERCSAECSLSHLYGFTHPALSPRGAPTLSAPDAAPSTDHSLPSAVLTTRWMDAEVAKTAKTKQEFDSWAPGVRLWQAEGALAALSGPRRTDESL
jgi:hypothetical protein